MCIFHKWKWCYDFVGYNAGSKKFIRPFKYRYRICQKCGKVQVFNVSLVDGWYEELTGARKRALLMQLTEYKRGYICEHDILKEFSLFELNLIRKYMNKEIEEEEDMEL